MRSRKAANDHVAEVARRRLELLTAELARVGHAHPEDASEVSPVPEPRAAEPSAQSTVPVPAAAARLRPQGGRHARRSIGPGTRLLGSLHDRLPPTLQGRVQLGSSHLTVIALLVAAALAVTAWWVIRADGEGTVVPAAAASSVSASALPVAVASGADGAPSATSEATLTATSEPTSSGSPVVIVDVAGKVRHPGIASLPLGSRVVDALKAAGGARKGVNLTSLNLARLLVDGEQIVVGVPPPNGVAAPAAGAPAASGTGAPGPLVNLNTAAQAELETLPGVGPVTAAAILQWRTDNGAFTSVDELLEVSGIGDATLAEIAPFVTI